MRYKLVISDRSNMDTCIDCCMAILRPDRTMHDCTADKEFFLKYGECTNHQPQLMHFIITCGDKLNINTRVI